MAFDQSLYNQSSAVKISVMVVDDDPVFLEIMSRMLEKSKYRDPSIMEMTVIAVRDSREALSTLKIQRNNIDLIITDYYMPGMNGVQLKLQITREFGNLPVIVMSSDTNKEEESLTCGALCFIPKPIKATDLTKIYQLALTCKRNNKSILWTEHNHNETNVGIPQQIQLLPEQANVSKTNKKRKFSLRSDSSSVNSSNDNCVSTDGSRQNRKRKSNGGSGDDVESLSQPSKKRKIRWSDYLHDLFLQAIRHIGLDKAVPKKILEFMNVSYLTRENVASHLQKYRQFLRRVAEQGSLCSSILPCRGIDSRFPYAHIREPYYTPSSSWYDTSLNNRSFCSKPRHGLGQSRLLSNTGEPVRFNQMPYNYMNRLSTYEPHHVGSNLTPIKTNLGFSTQPSQNEERNSFFEPTVMANKTGQTSEVLGFGKHGLSAINGNNFSNNTMSSYRSSTSNQPGISSYASSTSNQPGMRSQGISTPNQPGMSSYGSLTFNQPGMSSHEGLSPNQSGMSSHGSFSPNQLGMSSHGNLTPNQPGMSSHGSFSPNPPGMSSFGSLTPNQQGMSSHGNLTPTQQGMSSHGTFSPTQPGMSSFGSLTTNQQGMSSHGSLSPNQPGISSFGSLTSTQPGMSSFGSLTSNQQEMSSYGSLTPNQPGPSNFSYDMKLFLNNENTAYKPQPHANATIQQNLEIPQLDNLSLYDGLGNISELPCDISNFQFDHNKQQEEAVSTTKSELSANFQTELNQIFSLEEKDDWTFVNMNQGPSNEETSNTIAAPETNDPIININPNHDQEQDVLDFVDWSLLGPDPEDLANDYDFMDSLFTNDMN